jgi:hypothetical protein
MSDQFDHGAIIAKIAVLESKMDDAHRQRDRTADMLERHGDVLAKISGTQDRIEGKMSDSASTLADHGKRIDELETAKTKIETGVGIAHWIGGGGLLAALGSIANAVMSAPKK